MKILAIESSCDETATAVVEDGQKILSNVVVSQIDIFAAYGGVIPEIAARSHLEAILPVVHKALDDAGLTKDDIDAIAVTHTPGLIGSLMVGTLTARVLAILWQKPLYAVHHLKSHIYANWLEDSFSRRIASSNRSVTKSEEEISFEHASSLPVVTGIPRFGCSPLVAKSSKEASSPLLVTPQFPLLALVISGGHTQIIYMTEHNQFEIIGTTRDDAVGECFDKVAKILGLPYPGGPAIAKCAENGDPERYKLPHPQVDGLDFSFSGLKTAVLRAVQADCGLPITTPSYELKNYLSEQQRADFAASFQKTACEILLEKLKKALKMYPGTKSIVFAGGVSANRCLRELATGNTDADMVVGGARKPVEGHDMLKSGVDANCKQKTRREALNTDYGYFEDENVGVYFPEPQFSGDNAAMVGAAAYFEAESGVRPTDPYALSIAPRTKINETIDKTRYKA